MAKQIVTPELKNEALAWIARQPVERCKDCEGDGEFTCPECNGEGMVECNNCGGVGTCQPDITDFLAIRAKEQGLLEKLKQGIPYTKEDWTVLENLLKTLDEQRNDKATIEISIQPGAQA